MNPSTDLDYFSLVPPVFRSVTKDAVHLQLHHHHRNASGYSPEETASNASHSLFAHCGIPCEPSSTMSSMGFHHSNVRPQPVPLQNVLHVTNSDSSGASSSSSYSPYSSSPELARCSRCQRTSSFDLKTGKSNMVQYGLNLWYCNRCAALVGWSKG